MRSLLCAGAALALVACDATSSATTAEAPQAKAEKAFDEEKEDSPSEETPARDAIEPTVTAVTVE